MSESKEKPDSGFTDGPVPKAVVSRLSLYLRELQRLQSQGQETTSSSQLGQLLGITDAQVRKDLAFFGQFGYPGIGYRCGELVPEIQRILGTDQDWPVALVGVGNLGRALLRYRGFGRQGFRVVAAFDIDAEKIGATVDGVPVHSLDQLATVARQIGVRLAILAVPAEAAQSVADQLADVGLEGILNFAPVRLVVPEQVKLVSVDLAIELEQVSFAVVNEARS